MNRGFFHTGHPPTLFAAFLYFDMSFMVWVLLGPMGVQIARDLGLSAAEKGLMVATPVLAGALLQVVIGVLVDTLGPKRTGSLCQLVVIAGLLLAWFLGISSFPHTLALGLLLGVAGASFAVVLPLASRWYPPQHQGVALGVAAAGNIGAVLAALLGPGLAAWIGWSHVLGLVIVPLTFTFMLYVIVAQDAPAPAPHRPPAAYLRVLSDGDSWWFMFFYAVTFGGFVGLASSLSIYFNDQYGLSPETAGYCTATCLLAGALVRPVGGALADRIGGIRLLSALYGVVAAILAAVSAGLPSIWMALSLLVAAMLALGMGNGAVFQLVPQRFRKEIGVITGLVGMSGGLGGFLLASGLGLSRQHAGSYQAGFLMFAALALLALLGLSRVKRRWRTTWGVAVVNARL